MFCLFWVVAIRFLCRFAGYVCVHIDVFPRSPQLSFIPDVVFPMFSYVRFWLLHGSNGLISSGGVNVRRRFSNVLAI